MKRIPTRKEEIIYLLNKAVEKYKSDTGQEIILNTNRKNYEGLAIVLSSISNQLPEKWQEWGTDEYTGPLHSQDYVYPYRKYDITGGQIKDALSGIVSHPRSFLVDACYIYLYGVGRNAYEKNPLDENLAGTSKENKPAHDLPEKKHQESENELQQLKLQNQKKNRTIKLATIIGVLLFLTTVTGFFLYYDQKKSFEQTKKDMSLLPYQPSRAEIDSLEGIWLCYTGSPQARSSDPNRYHMVVSNIIDVNYKNGYFTFTRYGASFDHVGYMQYESPWLVSIFSYVRNSEGHIESPRHSLMRLDKEKEMIPVISASWNFDAGEKNSIIGIREVYVKQGKNGTIKEVLNTRENVGCHCKILEWYQGETSIKRFYLKNELLDTLPSSMLKALIDEKSMILRTPDDKLILNRKDSIQSGK